MVSLAPARTNINRLMTDLPNISRTYSPTSDHASEKYGVRLQQSTALPSFASLSEHASRKDDPDEVEIAPMSARLPCDTCNKLTPLLRDVAIAVAELNDYVQHYGNKPVTRVRMLLPRVVCEY